MSGKNNSQGSVPYTRPLRVTCLGKKQIDNKVEMALADNTMAVKAICFATAVADKVNVNESVIIRNFKIGRSVLMLNNNSIVTKCAQLDINDDISTQATYLLDPVTPPIQQITDILSGVPSTSPTKLRTIVGVIEQVCLRLSNWYYSHTVILHLL